MNLHGRASLLRNNGPLIIRDSPASLLACKLRKSVCGTACEEARARQREREREREEKEVEWNNEEDREARGVKVRKRESR